MFCVSLSESRYHTDGLGYRIRLADSAGLDDDVVEPFHAHQFIDLLDEIGLQGAADASVLQGHQTVVLFADDPSFLDEVRIDIHFSDIIDDDGEFNSFPVCKYMVYQGGLSAAEITCQQQDRYFFFDHCLKNFILCLPVYFNCLPSENAFPTFSPILRYSLLNGSKIIGAALAASTFPFSSRTRSSALTFTISPRSMHVSGL